PSPLLDRRALGVLLLAARQPDLELDPAFDEMQIERRERVARALDLADQAVDLRPVQQQLARARGVGTNMRRRGRQRSHVCAEQHNLAVLHDHVDRKSTRLNSSHEWISYAVFCLKKKNK